MPESRSDQDQEYGALKERVAGLVKTLPSFVTKAEFNPVKALVYGMTGLMLTAVGTAIIHLVIK